MVIIILLFVNCCSDPFITCCKFCDNKQLQRVHPFACPRFLADFKDLSFVKVFLDDLAGDKSKR